MKQILSIFFIIFSVLPTYAQEESPFKNLDYPELQVAPRASERLQKMADEEKERGFINHWPLMTSGLMTLLVGIQNQGQYQQHSPTDQEKKDADVANYAATVIGGSWLLIGSFFNMKSYINEGVADTKKIPAKDRRGELNRERYAEEVMERASDLYGTLYSLSVVTNLGASIYATGMAKGDNRIYGVLGVAASFLPWVFPSMYQYHYHKHLEYKRRVYVPLVFMDLDLPTGQPKLTLNWSF